MLLDPTLYRRREVQPDSIGRCLGRATIRAFLFGLPLAMCLALLSGPAAIALFCMTWILFPLAVLGGRFSSLQVIGAGTLLGCLQLSGAWLQWTYLEVVFSGVAQGVAFDRTLRRALDVLVGLKEDPGRAAALLAGLLLWGAAVGASEAALHVPATHMRRGGRAIAMIAIRLLGLPALIGLPCLGLVAGALTLWLGRGDLVLEDAFFVGLGIPLMGAGFLFLTASLSGSAFGFSARGLEQRLLGPDPSPRDRTEAWSEIPPPDVEELPPLPSHAQAAAEPLAADEPQVADEPGEAR